MAELRLVGLAKRYAGGAVLQDISLEVASGEFLVLVGPSGCGKSTLLRIVAGLVAPSAGDVWLDGRRVNELEPRERDVAMVFQNYALYPHMSVRANLAFPLKLARVPRAEIRRRVGETAALLGLEPLLERKPASLSGGQMQRVALGRAIVRRPRLFLFDEPLSNLDASLRAEMRGEIARLHRQMGVTTLYVTHDQAEAMTMGSRIAVLEAGRLCQVGPPLEVFERPRTRFVAGFIGSPAMNRIEGRIERETGAEARFRSGDFSVPAPSTDKGRVVLGIRPHEVELDPPLERALLARAVSIERLGSQTLVELDVGGAHLVASREGHVPLEPGQELSVGLPPRSLHWFDAASGLRLDER
jgi:ABC-type sugar transport system ATPase subunit